MGVVFFLVLARVTGLFIGAPVFSQTGVPVRFRAMLVLVLAAALLPSVPVEQVPSDGYALATAMVSELAIGATLGLFVRILFSAFQLAGTVISFQMGFALANTFDPAIGVSTPVIATIHVSLVTMLFLLIDGHHMLIRALAQSFSAFPIATSLDTSFFAQALLAQAKNMYEAGLRVAGPVTGLMILTNATIGFMNRVSPQLSIFSIGFPMTVLGGLLAVFLSIPEVAAFFFRAFAQLEQGIATMLQG